MKNELVLYYEAEFFQIIESTERVKYGAAGSKNRYAIEHTET